MHSQLPRFLVVSYIKLDWVQIFQFEKSWFGFGDAVDGLGRVGSLENGPTDNSALTFSHSLTLKTECRRAYLLYRQAMMRGCFREFDINGDGTIDRAELDNVFKSLGKQFSQEELDRMISLCDKDKSGTLDYEEFVKKVFG